MGAPIGRSEARPYLTVTGIVEAPYERVADVVLTVRPGPVGPESCFVLADDETGLVVHGGPERFSASTPTFPDAVRLEVDRDRASITTQGEWWYRVVCRLSPSDDGTQVTQECFNIATHSRWLLPVIKFGATGKQRARARQLIRRLGAHLDCPAYLI